MSRAEHPDWPSDQPPEPRGVNVLGICAVVISLLAFPMYNLAVGEGKGDETLPLLAWLVSGVIAVVGGAIGWWQGRRWGLDLNTSRLAVLLGLISLVLFVPISQRIARAGSNRFPCPSALKTIGQALMLYSLDHDGRMPARLADLVLTGDITTEVFTCPNGPDTRAAGDTPAEMHAELLKPGHISWVFLTPGEKLDDFGVDDLIVYEPALYHGGEGGNALFGDGHVNFLRADELRTAIAAAQARPARENPD